MPRAEQHGSALRRLPFAALLIAAIACGSSSGDTQPASSAADPGSSADPGAVPQVPEISFAGLRGRGSSALDLETAAEDAAEPDRFASMLTDDGFVGAAQRLYIGRRGLFARVDVRRWLFTADAGAEAFLASLRGEPKQLIGAAHPVGTARLPSSVSMVVHEPSGCCHEETPIYLASWQRDASVWTVRASGPAMSSKQAMGITMLVENETRDG